ncbi:MAG: hypothetical protein JNL10_13225 [Verrucomicrobiales bacterium]|nr:hypothetical protein [Verrucomicrobiales bacterium]
MSDVTHLLQSVTAGNPLKEEEHIPVLNHGGVLPLAVWELDASPPPKVKFQLDMRLKGEFQSHAGGDLRRGGARMGGPDG